jgi:type IV pilus assembly protein PilX
MATAMTNTGISSHQAGAALFMALIFLLILTVLGVFGMNISRLENMMAGNNQFQTLALGNAELTVDEAERNLEDMLKTGTKDTCYFPKATLVDPSPLNWPKSITDVACSYTPPKGSDGRYIVEYVGNGIDDDCGKGLGKGESKTGCIHYDFLVTAQADASRGARRTVQTVYQSGTAP